MRVSVRNNNVDSALRVLKKKVADKLFDLRSKQHYEKPSAKRKAAKAAAVKREKKRNKK